MVNEEKNTNNNAINTINDKIIFILFPLFVVVTLSLIVVMIFTKNQIVYRATIIFAIWSALLAGLALVQQQKKTFIYSQKAEISESLLEKQINNSPSANNSVFDRSIELESNIANKLNDLQQQTTEIAKQLHRPLELTAIEMNHQQQLLELKQEVHNLKTIITEFIQGPITTELNALREISRKMLANSDNWHLSTESIPAPSQIKETTTNNKYEKLFKENAATTSEFIKKFKEIDFDLPKIDFNKISDITSEIIVSDAKTKQKLKPSTFVQEERKKDISESKPKGKLSLQDLKNKLAKEK